MSLPVYKTKNVRPKDIEPTWWLVDATNQTVGRLASKIAIHVQGKHKTYFSPHMNCGDKVIVINTEKIRFTGKKMQNKLYLSYTGYPGGQRSITPKVLLEKRPTEVIRRAIKGMLRKNKLARKQLKNLFIYAGDKHPHLAQQPQQMVV